jgi:hypothetical protein
MTLAPSPTNDIDHLLAFPGFPDHSAFRPRFGPAVLLQERGIHHLSQHLARPVLQGTSVHRWPQEQGPRLSEGVWDLTSLHDLVFDIVAD